MANKLKVTLANNEIHHWTRSWWYFWIYDGFSVKTFRTEKGKIIKVTNRWVISIEDE